jgi:integrase
MRAAKRLDNGGLICFFAPTQILRDRPGRIANPASCCRSAPPPDCSAARSDQAHRGGHTHRRGARRRLCTMSCGPSPRGASLDNGGGHTFRRTDRSWLHDAGAPIGVQQKLMRHSDITTTASMAMRLWNPSASTIRSWFAGLWGMSNSKGTAARHRLPKGIKSPKS